MINLSELLQESNIKKFNKDICNNKNVAVFGLNLGEKIALVHNAAKTMCIVLENESFAKSYADALTLLGRRVVCLTRPVFDFSYHLIEFGSDTKDRQVALFNLINQKFDTLIITPEILNEQFIEKTVFERNIYTIKKDLTIEPDELVANLVSIGYVRVSNIDQPGQFAKRGDVVDVYPLNSQVPVRIYFFDTQIEKICTFNILSQYAIETINQVDICPNGYVFSDKEMHTIKQNVEKALKIAQKNAKNAKKPNEFLANLNSIEQLMQQTQNTLSLSATRFLSAFLPTNSILSYLNNPVVVVDNPKSCFDALNCYDELLRKNINEGVESGLLFSEHKNLYLEFENIIESIKPYTKVSFQSIMSQNKFFDIQDVISFSVNPLPKFYGSFKEPSRELFRILKSGGTAVFCAKDGNDAVFLEQKLKAETKLKPCIVPSLKNICENELNIIALPLKYGFSFDAGHYVFGFDELQTKKTSKKITKSGKNTFANEFTLPKVGEYVVHDVHGIGVCEGITKLSVNNATRDYLVLSYKNNDKLYVPTEQIDMLSRYVGSEKSPALNTLGGTQFEKIKQKVRASVKELAFDLVKLYKARQSLKGVKYEITTDLKNEIDESFEHVLTEDQAKAIEDVYADLGSGKIMDRLIVGDVGYGKTEVAIRAAFMAAMNGKQVAVLAPTTILCEQHFNSFYARLNAYGIKVACLNRFKTKAEQKQIVNDLKNGKISVLCGTHRMLSKDVVFFDLGLLVLDEEQKFGVSDKEKIKNLKNTVSVLTLSATPIPRTLHMSLVGIRDISTIETPPVERLPVQTIVSQFSNTLLSTAINREIDRGGQVLVVAPKIQNLDEIKKRVNELTDHKLRVEIAHGQMDKDKLETTMFQLYRGEIDVLIATSLIENGIDLPNANTLFVVHANDFGLSQLYQLRGRVGRSDKLAWAYFTYFDETRLTSTAYSRLGTLIEFSKLGSGFKIAMRDLEIRGAGDIFGAHQHGQMAKVGYDMYCKLLESEVLEMQGLPVVVDRPSKIDVDVDAFIPNSFCEQDTERMELYSAIAGIYDSESFSNVVSSIKDRFGNVPSPVLGLCRVSLLKTLCENNGVERLSITKKRVVMQIALDYKNFADLMVEKLAKKRDWRVYKKDNWAIFEKMNLNEDWQQNFDAVIKILT